MLDTGYFFAENRKTAKDGRNVTGEYSNQRIGRTGHRLPDR